MTYHQLADDAQAAQRGPGGQMEATTQVKAAETAMAAIRAKPLRLVRTVHPPLDLTVDRSPQMLASFVNV